MRRSDLALSSSSTRFSFFRTAAASSGVRTFTSTSASGWRTLIWAFARAARPSEQLRFGVQRIVDFRAVGGWPLGEMDARRGRRVERADEVLVELFGDERRERR